MMAAGAEPAVDSELRRHAAHFTVLVAADEGDSHARSAGAARPADAVDIALMIRRRVEVDHVRDSGHIDPARGDIGGNERVDLPRFEAR